jgi:uncharacterized protein (TIGR03435 family)
MRISKSRLTRNFWLVVGASTIFLAIGSVLACAQNTQPAAESPAVDPAARHYAFDVVSIRPSQPGGQPHVGPTTAGYQSTGLSIIASVLMAYLPLTGEAYYPSSRVKGMPDWVTEPYTIDAKISEADAAEWQKPEAQKVMLRSMLQAMLADRCKLVVHRESTEMPVYELVVSKGGPKFKESVPGAPHPAGVSLPTGGTLVPGKDGQTINLYGAQMASLTPVLGNFAGRPVKDKTGLTGLYDITLERDNDPAGGASGLPTYSVEALGLRMEKATASVDTLVIDHIERPTGN